MNYAFLTDVSCDLTDELAKAAEVEVMPMEFRMDGKSYMHYLDGRMMSLEEFYTKQKGGLYAKTTQINYNNFISYFEQYLKAGKDVIYTGISSGLSGTYNTCLMAVKDLQEKYPDRKIYAIDSHCDSVGLGYLIYLAGIKYTSGAAIDELKDYIEETRDTICHWFVVEDLDHLKKGGRISGVTATFGKALQIKPIIGVDEDGTLVNAGKIRGKSNVLPTLAKLLERDAVELKDNTVFIGHADNEEGALELRKLIRSKCKSVKICPIGPIIGSHVGSGMLAVLFIGTRNVKP